MGLSRRKFTREFKLDAIKRLETGTAVAAVARALEVSPGLLQRWRQEFRESPRAAFAGASKRRLDPHRAAQLEQIPQLLKTQRRQSRKWSCWNRSVRAHGAPADGFFIDGHCVDGAQP